MSDQKTPNDINFDDKFLNFELDNIDANADVNSNNDVNLNAELDELFNETIPTLSESDSKSESHPILKTDEPTDGLTLDKSMDVDLSDVSMSSDAGRGIDLSKITEDLNQHDLSDINLSDVINNIPSDQKTDISIDGTDAALLGAAAVAGGHLSQENKTAKKPGLFGKKDSASKAPTKNTKPTRDKADITGLLNNPQKLNKMILGGIIALVLIGVALYMAMSGNESTPAPAPAVAPATAPAPVNTPTENTEVTSTPPADTVTDTTQNGEDILPDIKPVVNPDEILNAEIPNDPALIKEEIDRLADKNTQIAEQEKLIQEQLTMMEDLTTAKAEHIALLEAQIAELEKQKGSTQTSAPTTEQK